MYKSDSKDFYITKIIFQINSVLLNFSIHQQMIKKLVFTKNIRQHNSGDNKQSF